MELTVELLEEKFDEYNGKYFGGSLKVPKFKLHKSFRVYGKFKCNKHAPGTPPRNMSISISTYYDYTEEQLRDILCHEMIHEKYERSRKPDEDIHGERFLKEAQRLNDTYGMNITPFPYINGIKKSKSAPRVSLTRFLWSPK
jgi:hypothetical protein